METLLPRFSPHFSNGLLLDSNLLLLYGIGLHDRSLVSTFKRTQQYNAQDFDRLQQFVSRFRRLITTPHILAELSNLAIDHRSGAVPLYVPTLLSLIRSANEFHVEKDVVLGWDCLPKLGVTDTAIIQLAKEKAYLVLTDDFPLFGYLQAFNCGAVNFNHIRTADWFGGE